SGCERPVRVPRRGRRPQAEAIRSVFSVAWRPAGRLWLCVPALLAQVRGEEAGCQTPCSASTSQTRSNTGPSVLGGTIPRWDPLITAAKSAGPEAPDASFHRWDPLGTWEGAVGRCAVTPAPCG